MMHIQSLKEATKDKEITRIKDPDRLFVPLFEQFGDKPEPVVSVGDEVKKYQVIGRSKKGFSAQVHAPVSGIIEEIIPIPQINGSEALTIIIRNDGLDNEVANPLPQINVNSPTEILKIIEDAGIVGMGGAQFPTAKKYDRKGKDVKSFIINGAECEPYLTSDYALMKHRPKEILDTILIVNTVLKAEEIIIAFEEENKDLESVFNPYLEKEAYKEIRLKIVPNEYPQGGELQLTKAVTGVVIPNDAISLDHGIIVSNVGTIYAIHNAIANQKPLIERVMTISGENTKHCGNYLVKIGTPVRHIIECCGMDTEQSHIVAGGPMMSPHVRNVNMPIYKGTLGILALPKTKVERLHCIWCGYCADVCPMNLMPMKYDQFYRRGKYEKLDEYNISDCIECAACEYICPSNVPLIESILEGKDKLKKIKDASD